MGTQKHFILLRGLTRESRHWGEFPFELQKSFPDARITLLDLPGAGQRYQEYCPLSVDEITRRLRSSLSPTELHHENIIFIGVSLGGMVAMKWSELYPQDLQKIVLINSSAGKIAPIWKRIKPQGALDLLHSVVSPRQQQAIIFERVCQKKENKAELVKLWQSIQDEAPVSLINAKRQILAAARFQLKKKLPVNGLILTSEGDELVHCDCSKALAKFLQWPLSIHQWAGHELTDDDPDWVIQQLKEFI